VRQSLKGKLGMMIYAVIPDTWEVRVGELWFKPVLGKSCKTLSENEANKQKTLGV
jgi:hypothetical protein